MKKIRVERPLFKEAHSEKQADLPNKELNPLLERIQGVTQQVAPFGPNLSPQLVVEGMEKEIERFCNRQQSKKDTLISVITLCGKSTSPATAKRQTGAQYIKLIDQIERQINRQAERGTELQGRLGGRSEHVRDDTNDDGHHRQSERRSRSPRSVDRETEHFLAGVKRSIAGDEPGAGESDDESPARKKRRILESKLPWYKSEQAARASGHAETQKTRDLLEYFSQNPAEVKRRVILAESAPSNFPSSQWDCIINGKPVDLDVLLSSVYHIGAPWENRGRIGEHELILGNSDSRLTGTGSQRSACCVSRV